MKVRNDFVTNSSSSSFIIAFRPIPDFDEETIIKYPFLKSIGNLTEMILDYEGERLDTLKSDIYKTVDDLKDFILDEESYWMKSKGWSTFDELWENDEEARNQYGEMFKYLDKGYFVAKKRVDYVDETTSKLIYNYADSNENFIIVECIG